MWPGLAAYRVGDGSSSAFTTTEIPSQVSLTRQRPGGTGHLLYNTTWTLTRNGGAVAASLTSALYRERAIPPASPWLDASAPSPPSIGVTGTTLSITASGAEGARWFVVRWLEPSGWSVKVVFGTERSVVLPATTTRVLVNAVDAAGNASSDAGWRRP